MASLSAIGGGRIVQRRGAFLVPEHQIHLTCNEVLPLWIVGSHTSVSTPRQNGLLGDHGCAADPDRPHRQCRAVPRTAAVGHLPAGMAGALRAQRRAEEYS